MNTAQEFSAIGSLRQWYQMVEGGAKIRHLVTPMSSAECLQLMEKALTLPAWFAKRGITCRVSGSKDVVKYGFKVAAGGSEFQVNPVHVPFVGKRPQAVTETSREAYHSLDFSTQRGKIAEAIWNESKAGRDVTRQELSVLHNFEKNAVCGRVNELLKASQDAPFEFEGRRYRLVVTEPRLSRFKGASNKPNEGLRWWPVDAEQAKLF